MSRDATIEGKKTRKDDLNPVGTACPTPTTPTRVMSSPACGLVLEEAEEEVKDVGVKKKRISGYERHQFSQLGLLYCNHIQ